ncbi:hypothetical protein, partial [Poseidonocella sp. HB161398]|uniref:hypothetical protein n=1 Tax=Poseidonocella sp. HB161398 TaxID=2320855 RepID=UPI00197EE1E8
SRSPPDRPVVAKLAMRCEQYQMLIDFDVELGMPASCSFSIPMICSSLNLDRFIVRLLVGADSTSNWRKMRVSGQSGWGRGHA